MKALWLIFWVVLCNSVCAFDMVCLRNGVTLEGKILSVAEDRYVFREKEHMNGPPTTWLKQAVRYVVYEDAQRANEILKLTQFRKSCSDRDASVKILSAKAFGETSLDAVKKAEKSISILTYYFSPTAISPVKEFYDALLERAKVGIEVTVIVPFSSRTPADIRRDMMQFLNEFDEAGVKILFLQEAKVQHKKLIIIDRLKVLMGSSNLTVSGMETSDNMNVFITDSSFVDEAIADFDELSIKAKPYDELVF